MGFLMHSSTNGRRKIEINNLSNCLFFGVPKRQKIKNPISECLIRQKKHIEKSISKKYPILLNNIVRNIYLWPKNQKLKKRGFW